MFKSILLRSEKSIRILRSMRSSPKADQPRGKFTRPSLNSALMLCAGERESG
jgi:hypothetical protein